MKIEFSVKEFVTIREALALYAGYMIGEGRDRDRAKEAFNALEKLMLIRLKK
ncbi:hypothetical protein ES703_71864 [subsurface metagenome]